MALDERDYGGAERFEHMARPATASTRTKLKKFLLRYYPPGAIHAPSLWRRHVPCLARRPRELFEKKKKKRATETHPARREWSE